MDLSSFSKIISKPGKVIITTHHKPDGDALGSSLALYHVLRSLGHEVTLITPSDFPAFFDWMPGREEIIIYNGNEQFAASQIAEAGLICCLDFNHLKRIGVLGQLIEASQATKLMVDHHLDPQGFDDFRFWDPEASSTCELIYNLLAELNLLEQVSKNVATCLYTGIMTDTGSFRFPRTTASLHRIVADLMEAGADTVFIHEAVYDQQSENRMRFLGYCLKDKLVILPELHTAYFSISDAELEKYEIETGDTEGIVNYALAISEVQLAVLMIQRQDRVKLSFRSKGDFPANRIAADHFGGGGHKNAAGGESQLSLDDTLNKFKKVMVEYQQLLVI